VFLENLPVAVSGFEQESPAALVQHEALREPHQGPALLRAAEEPMIAWYFEDLYKSRMIFSVTISHCTR
jgi:hypothetical protein